MKNSTLYDNKIFISFLILGVIEPGYIAAASVVGGFTTILHFLFTALQYVDILIAILVIFVSKIRLSSCTLLVILFQVFYLISDICNNVYSREDFIRALDVICFVMLIDIFVSKHRINNLLKVLSFWLGLFIVINFFTIVVYPEGMYIDNRGWTENYFLAYKNLHLYTFLPYLACKAVTDYSETGRLRKSFYLMTIIILLSCIFSDSSTSTISMALFTFCVIVFSKVDRPVFLNALVGFCVSAALSVAIIGFSFQSYFSGAIEFLFHKDATFTSRTLIWASALVDILKKPILGNGNVAINLVASWDITQAHNKYLDVLFTGGIVLLIIFVVMIIIPCIKLMRAKGAVANILNFVMIAYAILFLMEGRRIDLLFYPMLIVSYYICYFSISTNITKRVTVRLSHIR